MEMLTQHSSSVNLQTQALPWTAEAAEVCVGLRAPVKAPPLLYGRVSMGLDVLCRRGCVVVVELDCLCCHFAAWNLD